MPKFQFSAWLTHWDGASLASFEANARLMHRVYPSWYNVSEAGWPRLKPEATAARRARVKEIAAAHGVEVQPLINNYNERLKKWDSAMVRLVMEDRATRRMHIARLLELVKGDQVPGINLDYEDMYDVDRDAFSGFTEEVCAAFHAEGLKVSMAIHAKDFEPGTLGGSRSQDYGRLGAACDSLQVMGYDFHWPGGDPGPIGPPDWVGRVLDHCLKSIPVTKLELGIPSYGNDWGDGWAEGVNWERWTALLKEHGPERRDSATAELTVKYGSREVWMNDAVSITAKLWEGRERGVWQAAMWVLGSEDPRLWALIENLPERFA